MAVVSAPRENFQGLEKTPEKFPILGSFRAGQKFRAFHGVRG
jgi:hypothetical protein